LQYKIAIRFWNSGAEYYDLNVEYPPKACLLKPRSPASGAILGSEQKLQEVEPS
jgi:hypothetical protein